MLDKETTQDQVNQILSFCIPFPVLKAMAIHKSLAGLRSRYDFMLIKIMLQAKVNVFSEKINTGIQVICSKYHTYGSWWI